MTTTDLNAEKQALIKWLSVPRSRRYPQTRREFAKLLGVSCSIITGWQSDPALLEEVRKAIGANILQHYAAVWDALLHQATTGRVPAMKFYMEFFRDKSLPVASSDGEGLVIDRQLKTGKAWIEHLSIENVADAVEGLVEKALRGDVPSAKLYICFMLRWGGS